ncbi:hypothetical protein QZM43_32600 [Burkholderia orbicola]|uniref:hypothetical protein n=1 Tax=Burkholderia orbicola TaxID=2978683 RepID=UPI0026542923|nr:hypothetical protein [Burkholderia orbicola]MDN7472523.1 hypothetical protein [Burkholderia orbicola]MDN7507485.1 hypothetical protein [Burkholderia orbicola]
MTTLTLSQDLLNLATGTEHRSKMARFREMFDHVRVALDAGVRHIAIRDALARHGLELTVTTLDVMISRVRRERAIPLPRDARQGATRPASSLATPAPDSVAATTATVEVDANAPMLTAGGEPARPIRPRQTLEEMAAAQVKPKVSLPDDWRTGALTYEQRKALTPAQRQERERAMQARFLANPLAGYKPGQPLPPLTPDEAAARDDAGARATPDGSDTGKV